MNLCSDIFPINNANISNTSLLFAIIPSGSFISFCFDNVLIELILKSIVSLIISSGGSFSFVHELSNVINSLQNKKSVAF